jgi:putative glycosyltransferase (TIGR04372 family)
MRPLPSIEGVFDYAHSSLKTPELDIILPGAAAFHIGSSSGLSLVPLLFGTPCLFLNWYPFDMLPWGRRNWTVLKSIVALGDGRRVNSHQVYSTLGRIRERRMLNTLGHDLRNLQPAEISTAVEGFVKSLHSGARSERHSTRNLGDVLVFGDAGELRPLRRPEQPDSSVPN